MSETAPRLLSVEGWILTTYGAGAPSLKTVRRWIRGGYIYPAPEKHGRAYYVRADARYVDPANPPADLKPTGRACALVVKAGFVAPQDHRSARIRPRRA